MMSSEFTEGYPTIHDDIHKMIETALGRRWSIDKDLGSITMRAALSDVIIRLEEAERDMRALQSNEDIPDAKLDYPAMEVMFTILLLVDKPPGPTV
ncbi:MAG: hypothetical protein ABIQ64_00305 [Candidatus Saccharimonadales bacterium]